MLPLETRADSGDSDGRWASTVSDLGCLGIDLGLRLSDGYWSSSDDGTRSRSGNSLLSLGDGDEGGLRGGGGGGSLCPDLLRLKDIGAVRDAASRGDGLNGSPLASSGWGIVVRGLGRNVHGLLLLLGVGDDGEHEGSVGRGRGGGRGN